MTIIYLIVTPTQSPDLLEVLPLQRQAQWDTFSYSLVKKTYTNQAVLVKTGQGKHRSVMH